MKTQIDLKSAVCGLVLGVLTMFVIGAGESSSIPVGRYQVAVGSISSVIVDTATGQSWANNLAEGRISPRTEFLDKKTDK
jgi:hypothetical protein